MAKQKSEEILILGLLFLAFFGKGALALRPSMDIPSRSGTDSTSPDPSRPTVDPATGKPNNDNSEIPDPSGANTKSPPPVDPMTAGNGMDKSQPLTGVGSPPPIDSGIQAAMMMLGNPVTIISNPPSTMPDFSGKVTNPLPKAKSIFEMLWEQLSGLGKGITGLIAPIVPIIDTPILIPAYAQPAIIPETGYTGFIQKIIAANPKLTENTGFAGGIMGEKTVDTGVIDPYTGTVITSFIRNSPQEALVKAADANKSLLLSMAINGKGAFTDPAFLYYDKKTMMYI